MDRKNYVRLDLFLLHDNSDNSLRKCIVAKGKDLKKELGALIKIIEKNEKNKTFLVKYIMKKFNISIASAERLIYLKRNWYPLFFIKELLVLSNKNNKKFEIQDKIEFLKVTQPPLKVYVAKRLLSVNLCKFIGAFAADGTLSGTLIRITENKKSTIVAFKKIIDKEFGVNSKIVKIKRSKEEWGIEFKSKVIARYITKIFGFPDGSKTYIFKEPRIIKNSSKKFREAYALGALTFEAGVGIKNSIEFSTVNKDFRDSLCDVLQKNGLKVVIMKKKGSTGLWRFWSGKITKEEALRWQNFFELDTEKWFKLNDYINGFSREVNSFDEAVQIFDSIYPFQSSSKVSLKDILIVLKELKEAHRYKIVDYLVKRNDLSSYGGKWAHSLRHYLDLLKNANMITVERRKFGKKKSFGSIVREVYIFNENVGDWRVPFRPIINC
ncbi:MAG: hypothetical protein KKH88_04145 [Nanoarchaeota archaeon]|nr:hypothetical protein [Nanoarchaeota archaeon]